MTMVETQCISYTDLMTMSGQV